MIESVKFAAPSVPTQLRILQLNLSLLDSCHERLQAVKEARWKEKDALVLKVDKVKDQGNSSANWAFGASMISAGLEIGAGVALGFGQEAPSKMLEGASKVTSALARYSESTGQSSQQPLQLNVDLGHKLYQEVAGEVSSAEQQESTYRRLIEDFLRTQAEIARLTSSKS